ncbi:MAG: hypothetical protein WBO44_14355 [Saprospiraceae bacterium]
MKSLKEQVEGLVLENTPTARLKLYSIFLDELIFLLNNHKKFKYDTDVKENARIILQMLFTRALCINKMIEGVSYDHDGIKLNRIIDPTAIAVLTRNMYEMIAVFHLMYSFAHSDEEKLIIYSLWRSAGLQYRQRFSEIAKLDESKAKFKEEQDEIQHFYNLIRKQNAYKSLDPSEIKKIEQCIKDKDFKITFENGKVNMLSWQDCSKKMGLPETYFGKMYTYFSLYAHPSYISAWQFSIMFDKERKDNLEMALFNLNITTHLLSIFIADYIKYFPELLQFYEKQDLLIQIVINFHNKAIRGESYSINKAYEKLDE